MNKSQAIEAIKNATKAISLLFYEANEFAAVKAKNSDQDISIEGEYAKGTKVSVSSSTGSIPAPDAKYSLSNGKNFSTKGGVIDEVMADDSADDSDEDFSATESEVEAPAIEATESAEGVTAEGEDADKHVKSAEESPAEKVEATESAIVEPEAIEVDAVKDLTDKVDELTEAFNKIKEAFATKEDLKLIGESFKAIKSAFDVLSDTPAEFSKVDTSVRAKEEKAKKLDALASLMQK